MRIQNDAILKRMGAAAAAPAAIAFAAFLILSAGSLRAQPARDDVPPTPPASPTALTPSSVTPTPAAPARPAEPTLDELLGLTKKSDPSPAGANPGPANGLPGALRQDLNERLKGAGGEALERAATLMNRAAERLERAGDASLETQRVQQETLDALDQVISQAKKQQGKSSKSSSSSSKSSKQQQQQQSQAQQQESAAQKGAREAAEKAAAQAAAEAQARTQRGEGDGRTDLPGRRDGALAPGIESARAAWGALPARVRDALVQGSGEKFSTLYQRSTEEFYRRLAEQKPGSAPDAPAPGSRP
ncbi:hypothetical protein BH11PLA1_BH11PLA1_23600 [soil metagenome]